MEGLLEQVAAALDSRCLANRLRKEGCDVRLKGVPAQRLIIDFDKTGSPLSGNENRCDYLVISKNQDEHWVTPLELKKGWLDASRVIGQLKAGASAAEKLIPKKEIVDFQPVAALGGHISRRERSLLRKKQGTISFHGHRARIRLMKCGGSLIQTLKK